MWIKGTQASHVATSGEGSIEVDRVEYGSRRGSGSGQRKTRGSFLIKTASFATAYKRLKNLFFFIFLFSISLYSQSFSLLCDFRRQAPPLVASGRRRCRWSSDKIRASFNRSEPPGSESVIPLARKSFKVHESEFLDLDQNCFLFFFFCF